MVEQVAATDLRTGWTFLFDKPATGKNAHPQNGDVSYGALATVVIHRDFEIRPDGSLKTVARRFSLDRSRPLEALTSFAVLILLSFMLSLIQSPFWSRSSG